MQIKKETVQDNLMKSALNSFARQGFQKTTIAAVAKDSGVSTGNVYRYFKTKDSLFQKIFPPALLRKIEDRLRAVTSAATNPTIHAQEIEAMLNESLALRLHLVVLLEKATGSPAEGFRQRILDFLVAQAEAYAKHQGKKRFRPEETWLLRSSYSSFLSLAAQALQQEDAKVLRQRLQVLRAYHLGGLQPLLAEASR